MLPRNPILKAFRLEGMVEGALCREWLLETAIPVVLRMNGMS